MSGIDHSQRIPKEEVLDDLKNTEEKVEGLLTMQDYREKGKYSLWHFQGGKFENFNSAKEEAGLEKVNPGFKSTGEPVIEPKYTKEEIKEEASKFMENTEEEFTISNLAKYMDSPVVSLENWLGVRGQDRGYFESLYDLLESIGYSVEDIYQEWSNVIKEKEMYGWIRYDQFRDILSRESQIKFLKHYSGGQISSEEFFQYVNEEVDGLYLRMGTKGGNGTRIYIKNEGVDRFSGYKEKLPEMDGVEDVFDECISYGKRPKSTLAALKYMCGDKTQREVADEVGTQGISLRGTRDFIVDEGLDDKLGV